jgi:DNA-nicking Smr family endonuclease
MSAMTRKKKKKKQSYEQKNQKKKSEIFNPALEGLASIKKKSKEGTREPRRRNRPEPQKKPDEIRFFLEAMSDVRPLSTSKNTFTPTPNPDIRPAHPVRDDELEVLAHLSDLISGTAEMDITFSDEYIEGSVEGFSRKLMRRLKKGQFPIQDYIDLHGLKKREAEIRIRDFLLKSHRLGLRCVLVVHGRGLNSENNIPVLKERLPVWLNRGPVKKIVLAFSTARTYDGGTGAIYILLRKRKAGL